MANPLIGGTVGTPLLNNVSANGMGPAFYNANTKAAQFSFWAATWGGATATLMWSPNGQTNWNPITMTNGSPAAFTSDTLITSFPLPIGVWIAVDVTGGTGIVGLNSRWT